MTWLSTANDRTPAPKLRTQASESRPFAEEVESLDDRVDEPIGRRRAGVLGDVDPDLLEVLLSEDEQPIGHLRLPRASGPAFRLVPLGELTARGLVIRTPFAAGQLIEAGLPVLLLVNIIDEAERVGMRIDIALLEEKLGIPVVGAAIGRKRGINELRQALAA